MQTSNLTGAALDWAVAKCGGLLEPRERYGKMEPPVMLDMEYWSNGEPIVRLNPCPDVYYRAEYDPSTNWEHGGPIIERERTEFDFNEDTQMFHAYDGVYSGIGPTHLISAMRCYVASKLGDEVELPPNL